jgi:hypothetical protein
MSKVISFSISDRYLDKLRSLYPSLTDNLAVKQFVTDGLDGSLGNSLDVSLDDGLDDRVKTLIESWVDGLLEVRLDASVGKLITSLSERMARLEERLDDSLDGRLDDMEPLLKREKECSIATAPIPTGETSPDEPVQPAIGTVTPEVSPSPPLPPGTDAIASIDGTVESVEPNSSIETVASAIESVTDSKPWYTIDDLLDCHYSGWPETKEGLRKKAKREHWPKRTRRGSKGNPYEYQAVLPE